MNNLVEQLRIKRQHLQRLHKPSYNTILNSNWYKQRQEHDFYMYAASKSLIISQDYHLNITRDYYENGTYIWSQCFFQTFY